MKFNPLFGFLSAALLVSSALGQAPQTPVKIALNTGSNVATWTLRGTGKQRKTPVIYLHGGPGLFTTESVKEKGTPFRAAGFDTVYFDQAGGGQSDRIPVSQYTLQRAVDDIEALRLALKAEKIILWGNSYGADLAALYARRYPDRLAGMILSSPGSFPGTSVKRDYNVTERGDVKLSSALTSAVSLIDKKGPAAEASLSQERAGILFDEITSAELMNGMVCKGSPVPPPLKERGGNLYANRLLQKELKSNPLPKGTALTSPLLIIRGDCDFLPLANAERYHAALGGQFVPIAKSGHGLFENTATLVTALDAFITGPLATVE
jgi:pimeloyl-ACP methyl ester carboxylesterase